MKAGDKVWVIKNALTAGIIETTVREPNFVRTSDFIDVDIKAYFGYLSFYPRELAASLEEAYEAVEKQRAKKIISLEKQLAKVRAKVVKVKKGY